MSGMLALAKRNTLCYLRDRQSVLFSLMAVLIVVLLYLLFLRDILISSYPEMDGMPHLIDAWVMAGILGIVPVTASAGSLQTMVEDRVSGRDRDIAVTPLSRWEVVGGHVLSTFASGLVMSLIALVICLAYLVAVGCPLSAAGVAECIVLLVPSALTGSVIVYAMVSFIRSTGAFSGFFTVVSVMIGFLSGIYMPMGTMPEAMQVVGTLVPASQMAALFREALCSEALGDVFSGAPADVLEGFRTDMGFDLALGGFEFSAVASLVYSLAVAALFMAIAVMAVRRSGRCSRNCQADDADLEVMFAHTTIHVSDFDKSLTFYTEGIGLPVASVFEAGPGRRIAMLGERDGMHLEIIGDGDGGVDYPCISIGFYVKGAGELAARLDPGFRGPISPSPGVTFYFVRDPDGYCVQLLEG